jgi:hypothetical protein
MKNVELINQSLLRIRVLVTARGVLSLHRFGLNLGGRNTCVGRNLDIPNAAELQLALQINRDDFMIED